MSVFEFLNLLEKDNIRYKIKNDCSGWIAIEIPMNDHYWSVSFDESGYLDTEIYKVVHESTDENPDKILELFDAVRVICHRFAKNNGVVFQSPFTFKGSSGDTFKVEGIFPEFGSKGVVVTSNKDNESVILEVEKLTEHQHIHLQVNDGIINNEDCLKEVLSEFCWSGEQNIPSWINKQSE